MREGGADTATVQVDNPASLTAGEDDAPAEGVAAVPVDQAGVEQQIEWISPAGEVAPQVSAGRIPDPEVFDDGGIVQSTGFQISDRFRMTMELKLNSLSMESGRNYLRGCPNENVDLSIVRRIAFGKIFTESRRLEFRADIFNALNTVVINAVSTTATFNTPAGMALQNNQYLSDGTLNPTRLQPKNAGFGAATGAQAMRNLQLQLRFSF